MAQQTIRGIQQREEINSKLDRRDVRPLGQRFLETIESGEVLYGALLLSLGGMLFFPQVMEIVALVAIAFFAWTQKQRFSLAFRLPVTSKMLDHSEPLNFEGKPVMAKGMAFLGNEMGTKRELWLGKMDMCTHILCFGSTGAGKALRDEEPVLTPTGWVPMASLRVGDAVWTPDRQIATVQEIFPQGMQPLWRMTFDDGRWLDVTPDHLWGVAAVHLDGPWQASPRKKQDMAAAAMVWGTGAASGGSNLSPQPSQTLDVTRRKGAVTHVMSTDELEQALFERRDLGENQHWCIPLCEAVGDAVVMWDDDHEIAARAALLCGVDQVDQYPFPSVWMTGSVKQREHTWAKIKKMGEGLGPVWLFDSFHHEALLGIQQLAWSLGFWAKIEPWQPAGSSAPQQGWSLVVDTDRMWLKIESIVPLHTQQSCRCIKISDPKGLFVTRDWIVTHNTETLISLAYNTLVTGSGFIYVDGKGDNGLWAKIFSVVRYLGREDDLLVMNFMTGGRDMSGPQKVKSSNTLNPFIVGSAPGLTELLVGLMDEAGGDNAMWKGRAISLIQALMLALVYLRDHDGLLMGVEVIRNNLVLENIQKLSKRHDLPPHVIQAIKSYLRSLPGYQDNAPKQSETVMDQHGYLQMQFTRILGSLADVYGYIFKTNLGEVDFFDVVLNRRILVVLLPAMEKSPDELGNLGKIIVASLKQMMATGLGDILEGDYEQVIETKPTTSPSPFMCILDEYGYYVVKGASVMPAQARSLGFCMVFAGQDYPAFKKNNNAEEAVSTIGNCNIKIFMKLEDPTETFDLAEKSIGEANVGKTTGLARTPGSLTGSYQDQQNANVERRKRADWLDFKDHGPGEAHIVFKSILVRAEMFFANPPKTKQLQLNSFLRVEPPHHSEIAEWDELLSNLEVSIVGRSKMKDLMDDTVSTTPARLKMVAETLSKQDQALTAGMAALGSIFAMAMQNASTMSERTRQVSLKSLGEDETGSDKLHVFRHDLNEDEEEDDDGGNIWGQLGGTDDGEDSEEEEGMLLHERQFTSNLAKVERSLGVSDEESMQRSESIAADMRVISSYPKTPPDPMEADDYTDFIEELEARLDPHHDDQDS